MGTWGLFFLFLECKVECQHAEEAIEGPKIKVTERKKKIIDHDGSRTRNLPIRSRTPYPLGHAAASVS